MKLFKISDTFIKVIKNQAINSENEIYGWLIGYVKDKIPNILAIFECKNFDQQTLISAVPNAQEFQELSSLMPQGIGPIGIYHSHPFSSEVFHSHTDDATLLSLSNQFSDCISIVTNGHQTNYYKMGRNKKTEEIKPKFDHPKVLNYIMLKFEEELDVKIDKQYLNEIDEINELKIQIINHIRNYYEIKWKGSQFIINDKPITKNHTIDHYLSDKEKILNTSLKISPLDLRNKDAEILISKGEKSENDSREFIKLKLKIKTKLPIYLKQKNIRFKQLNNAIRTELLSNNILRKIYDSVIDFEKREIILPQDFFLRYFGFLIRFLFFKDSSYNEQKFSQKNKELVYKIISQFHPFIGIELPRNHKTYFRIFLTDIEKLSSNFNWYKEVKNQINVLYTNLMLI